MNFQCRPLPDTNDIKNTITLKDKMLTLASFKALKGAFVKALSNRIKEGISLVAIGLSKMISYGSCITSNCGRFQFLIVNKWFKKSAIFGIVDSELTN